MRVSVALALCCLCTLSFAADPAHASIRKTTNIPAEELGSALQTVAKDYDFQVLYRTEIVKDLRTQGAVGSLTSDEALGKVLKGTGLTYKYLDSNTVTIMPASASSSNSQPASAGSAGDADTTGGGKKSSQDFRVAQVDQGKGSGAAAVGNQSSNGQQISNGPSSGLAEIIVTAQKKSENLQNVPLSVSTVSTETLAKFNYTQLTDYAATIPGLQVDSGGAPGFVTVTLRGISTGNTFGSTTTAIYVDNIPVSSSGSYTYNAAFGLDLFPYDLDRVEVLKGPQGTLYGASSMGGLLKYVLNTPDLDTTTVRVGGDVSSIDHASGPGDSGRIYASAALIPGELAISVSGVHSYTPGFIDNSANGAKDINHGTQDAARFSAYWQPSEQLAVKINALVNHSDYDGLGQIPVTLAGQPVYGRYDEHLLQPDGLKTQTTLYSADVTYHFGWGQLTSVTGYQDARNEWHSDSSLFGFAASRDTLAPFVDEPTLRKFTQEVRLSSLENQRLQWTVGGFYTNEHTGLYEEGRALNPGTLEPNPLYDPWDNIKVNSGFKEIAGFASATYKLTDQWDVSGGVRYSHNNQDDVTLGNGVNGSAGFLFGDLTTPLPAPVFRSSDSATTYSVSSSYHFEPNAMLYARIASGYRPGGSNFLAGTPPSFAPDRLTNYEVGLKSDWLDHRFLVNLDVFYIDWKKIQISQSNDNGLLFTGNAGSAQSDGIELTTEYALTEELRIGLNGVFDDAKLTSDAAALGATDGDRLPLTARYSAAVTGDWTHQLTSTLSAKASVVSRYVGDRYVNFPASGDFFRIPSYDSVDLSAGVTNGHWTMRLFGKNVTDKYAYLRYYNGRATILEPRTVGLSVDVTF